MKKPVDITDQQQLLALIMKMEGCVGHALCRQYDKRTRVTYWFHHETNDCRRVPHNKEKAFVFTDEELIKAAGNVIPPRKIIDFIRRTHDYGKGDLRLATFDEAEERERLRPV